MSRDADAGSLSNSTVDSSLKLALDTLSKESKAEGSEAIEAALRSSSLLDLSEIISVDTNFNRDLKFIHKNIRFSIDIRVCYLLRQTRAMAWEYKAVIKGHKFCKESGWLKIPSELHSRLEVLLSMKVGLSTRADDSNLDHEFELLTTFGEETTHFESFRYERGGVIFTPSEHSAYTQFDKNYLSNVASIISFCVEKDASSRFLSDVYSNLQNMASQAKNDPGQGVSGAIPAAYLDESSGLPNQSGFLRLLRYLIDSQVSKFHLVVLSIDKFAYFCNLFDVGTKEKFLAGTIDRIKAVIKNNNSLSHIGHSDLAFVMMESEEAAVTKSINEIINNFSEDLQVDDVKVRFEICAGFSAFPGAGSTADALLKMANVALYRATQKSSHRLVGYKEGMEKTLKLHLELGRSIRQAIHRNEFEVYFQPIVEAHNSETIAHFESLVRWIHPDEGTISPGLFIEIAEASGDIIPLGYWVTERVCQHLARPNVPSNLSISINLSPVQIRETHLADNMLAILSKYDIAPNRIGFEITETAAMLDPVLTGQRFDELNQAGFKLSVDDFGTGHSSLSYLLNFSFQYLKIDKSFIDQSGSSDGYAVIASSMIDMAHKLGMQVICEGIETRQQMEMVTNWGADQIQGYLISRPMPIEHFYPKAGNT